MFTGLEVYSPQLSIPTMGVAFTGIDDDPVHVRNIEGLNPVKASVNTAPYATIDGESYSGSFVGKRNIVITFGLNPDYEIYTMSGLRHLLYRYFMPKAPVTLQIGSNDLPAVAIQGIVESVEPTIFAKDPEMQVSVICPKADFIAIAPTIHTGLVGDGTAPLVIDYPGNIETGFTVKVGMVDDDTYEGPLRVITESISPEVFSTTVDLAEGIHYEMSSVRGSKYARDISDTTGLTTNQFQALDLDSKWPQLHPGDNNFAVICQLGSEDLMEWTLTYYARFGGL